MNDLRKLAHLWEQLGEERFQTLISSDNTGNVKDFCDQIHKDAMPLPTSMTISERTYDILGFLLGDEKLVHGHTMVERAVKMNANLGKDDGQYLLDNQQDIPIAFQGKGVFVFTDWRHPDDSLHVCYVVWHGDRWVPIWYWLKNDWSGRVRLLRRK